jgi:hypothetical protein
MRSLLLNHVTPSLTILTIGNRTYTYIIMQTHISIQVDSAGECLLYKLAKVRPRLILPGPPILDLARAAQTTLLCL